MAQPSEIVLRNSVMDSMYHVFVNHELEREFRVQWHGQKQLTDSVWCFMMCAVGVLALRREREIFTLTPSVGTWVVVLLIVSRATICLAAVSMSKQQYGLLRPQLLRFFGFLHVFGLAGMLLLMSQRNTPCGFMHMEVMEALSAPMLGAVFLPTNLSYFTMYFGPLALLSTLLFVIPGGVCDACLERTTLQAQPTHLDFPDNDSKACAALSSVFGSWSDVLQLLSQQHLFSSFYTFPQPLSVPACRGFIVFTVLLWCVYLPRCLVIRGEWRARVHFLHNHLQVARDPAACLAARALNPKVPLMGPRWLLGPSVPYLACAAAVFLKDWL